MVLTDRDVDVLARTLYGEASNQKWEGLIAVAFVVANRAKKPKRFGEGVIGVCLKPKNFSCWNHDDPNRIRIMRVTYDNVSFVRCVAAAASVLSGSVTDITGGADHYHTIKKPAYAETWPPYWVPSMTKTVTIGDHVFYREHA